MPYRCDAAAWQNNLLALLAAAVPGSSSMGPPAFSPASSFTGTRSQSVQRPTSRNGRLRSAYRPQTGVSPKDPSAGPIEYDTPSSHIGSAASPTNLSLWDVAQAKEAALSNLGRGGAGLALKSDIPASSPSDLQPDPIDLGQLEPCPRQQRGRAADFVSCTLARRHLE